MLASGTSMVTFMIGSSSVGPACATASFMPRCAAVSNACEEESTGWYLPSTSATRT
jgi:hypothetical protein